MTINQKISEVERQLLAALEKLATIKKEILDRIKKQ
jgi:hypothetical protein